MRPQNTGGCTMNKVLVGVVSAADFERARDYISDLSSFRDYEDWLDSRYGHFMGLSMGGAEASLETVVLDDFLDWCGARRLVRARPRSTPTPGIQGYPPPRTSFGDVDAS